MYKNTENKNIISSNFKYLYCFNFEIMENFYYPDYFFFEKNNTEDSSNEDTNHSDDSFLINNNDFNFSNFIYLNKTSFISFFINNFIDIPICFKKSFSLKRRNFELPLLKFVNYLMKKGKKEKTFSIFFNTINELNIKINYNNKINFNENNYKIKIYEKFLISSNFNFFFFYWNNFFFNNSFFFNFNNYYTKNLNNDIFWINNEKPLVESTFIKNKLLILLTKIIPVFSYFIYSVDKNVKKYTRKKSGKYSFIWKYIAPYKRHFITIRWIIKEIKFSDIRNFSGRILNVLNLLNNDIEKSFAWRSKTFSHNYVFRYFKKSLMFSLITQR